jgi:hypothetical protein
MSVLPRTISRMQRQEPNLHRNNAAEWLMWVCLLPVFLLRAFVSSCLKKER